MSELRTEHVSRLFRKTGQAIHTGSIVLYVFVLHEFLLGWLAQVFPCAVSESESFGHDDDLRRVWPI